jgi:hypothetical protein
MLTLVVYVPGAGGNHLKNLLCLSNSYANHSDLRPEVYENPDPNRPPGEVWCVGGRNLQKVFFERINSQPDCNWVLAAHVGEMFEYQQQLSAIENKQIVVVTLDHEHARRQLDQRQVRLGQCIHPYWLDEELTWVYQPGTLQKIFNQTNDQYYCLSIRDFWSTDFVQREFAKLTARLNVNLDFVAADRYHRLWCAANQFSVL